jgi:penicillin-binding protein 1A
MAANSYNRATQAGRQTGSAFKPFIYSAALEKGLTLATIVNDAPIVLEDPITHVVWRPQNDSQTFHGPTSLRTGLVRSVNLVSIRILQNIGIPYAVDYLKKFGFVGSNEAPPYLTLALGTGVTTPLKMATGYAVFANSGYKVTPFLIDKIVISNNNSNKTLFEAKPSTTPEANNKKSKLPEAPRVITPQNAYLITDALKDVIKRGTATKAKNFKSRRFSR